MSKPLIVNSPIVEYCYLSNLTIRVNIGGSGKTIIDCEFELKDANKKLLATKTKSHNLFDEPQMIDITTLISGNKITDAIKSLAVEAKQEFSGFTLII